MLASVSLQAQMVTAGQFQVSETGAATYSIPIQVTSGVGGMEPKLSLSYSSQNGNGPLGIGWSLGGLGGVGRCPRTLAQDGVRGSVNYDNNDRYCLDGQRLMAIIGVNGSDGTEYRTERESFAKIVSYGVAGNGPAWFKVWTKAGQVMEYGNTADSRIEAQGKTSIRTWALNRIEDSKGNYLTATYTKDASNGDYYPGRIDFSGNRKTNSPPANSVLLKYESRPDSSSFYHAGSLIKNVVRLKSVENYVGALLTGTYQITYKQQALTRESLITKIQRCAAETCLIASEFNWGSGGDGTFTKAPDFNIRTTLLGSSSGAVGSFLGDFNGDGKTDVLSWSNDPTYNALYLSNGDGTFTKAPDFNIRTILLGSSSNTTGSFLGDFNGDGKTDILVWNDDPTYNALYLSNGDGTFTKAAYFNIRSTSLAHSNRTVGSFLGDFDGDGRTDVMTWSNDPTYNALYLSNGDGTFTKAPDFNIRTTLLGSSSGTTGSFLGDFNGDGKTDVMIWSNDPTYNALYLSNGDGTFTKAPDFNIRTTLLASSSGTAGSLPGDFNGDGKMDVMIWSNDPTYNSLYQANGGVGQINSVFASDQTKIDVVYQPLTNKNIYTRDGGTNASTYPVQDVQGAMYVASSVSSSNGIGGATSVNYTYGGLKSDLAGRGMLGFRWMQTKQVETGLASYTEYLQNWPYIGLPATLRKTISGGGNNGVLSQITNGYNCNDAASTTAIPCSVGIGKRYFIYANQSVESGWDYNGAVLPVITTKTEYDNWGNATKVDVSTSDGYGKTTTNVYSNDSSNWYLGRLIKATVISTVP